MRQTDFQSVDEYIASQPDPARAMLARVRSAIRKAEPEIEEVISYNMPTYKLHGRRVLHFAAWNDHYAIYGATEGLTEAFKDELAPFEIGKGTIRFPLDESVPMDLIRRIVTFRVKELLTSARPPSGRKPRAAGRRRAEDTQ